MKVTKLRLVIFLCISLLKPYMDFNKTWFNCEMKLQTNHVQFCRSKLQGQIKLFLVFQKTGFASVSHNDTMHTLLWINFSTRINCDLIKVDMKIINMTKLTFLDQKDCYMSENYICLSVHILLYVYLHKTHFLSEIKKQKQTYLIFILILNPEFVRKIF